MDLTVKTEFTDIEIETLDGSSLYFSKFVLVSNSDYFKTMFTSKFKEGQFKTKIKLNRSKECLSILFNGLLGIHKLPDDIALLDELLDALNEYLIKKKDDFYKLISNNKEYYYSSVENFINILIKYDVTDVLGVVIDDVMTKSINIEYELLDFNVLKYVSCIIDSHDMFIKIINCHKDDDDKLNAIIKIIDSRYINLSRSFKLDRSEYKKEIKKILNTFIPFKHNEYTSRIYWDILKSVVDTY